MGGCLGLGCVVPPQSNGVCLNQHLGASPWLWGGQTRQRWAARKTHNQGLDAAIDAWLIKFTKKPPFYVKT